MCVPILTTLTMYKVYRNMSNLVLLMKCALHSCISVILLLYTAGAQIYTESLSSIIPSMTPLSGKSLFFEAPLHYIYYAFYIYR